MIKQVAFILVLIVIFSCGGKTEVPSEGNELDNQPLDETTLLKQDISAYKTVVNVIRETGLAQNFVILPGNVNGVAAYIKNNERILEYNPDFMQKLQGDTNWYGISVLARQIGHHLSLHELKGGKPSAEEELEADKYAGFVLHKMGAKLEDAISAIEDVIKENNKAGIATNNDRILALTKGWKEAQILSGNETLMAENNPKNPTVEIPKSKQNLVKNPEYVYQIFLALDTTFYYIDKKDVIFAEQNKKYIKVGEKKESTKPGFDWIFLKGANTYGVDLKGRMWAFSFEGNFHIVGQAVKLN